MRLQERIRTIILVLIIFLSFSVKAADLIQVYDDALKNDPTFKRAEAKWLSERENLPIAVSAYLPLVTANGFSQRAYQTISLFSEPPVSQNGYYNTYGYSLSLTQPIFNAPAWFAIRGAKVGVKAATAAYLSAAQDLMVRTAKAYFEVLKAYDNLRYTLTIEAAVKQQLTLIRRKFHLKLESITSVYDAEYSYNQAAALEIVYRNELADRIEELRAITNHYYTNLAGVGMHLPLVNPQPNSSEEWVKDAQLQNYDLQSQNFTTLQAHEKIKENAANHLPVLNLSSSYADSRFTDVPNTPNYRTVNGNVGLGLNVNLFNGGQITAKTRQAEYNYLDSSSQLEVILRQVINKTRQAFLGVVLGINQIRADDRTLLSAKNKVKTTKAGYKLGTRNSVELMQAFTTLYETQQKYAADQYAYLNNTILLKQAAARLSVADLAIINRWLSKSIDLENARAETHDFDEPILVSQAKKIPKKITPHHTNPKHPKVYVLTD